MRLDFPPKYTETIGAVKIHSLQKIYEIDSGHDFIPLRRSLTVRPLHLTVTHYQRHFKPWQ